MKIIKKTLENERPYYHIVFDLSDELVFNATIYCCDSTQIQLSCTIDESEWHANDESSESSWLDLICVNGISKEKFLVLINNKLDEIYGWPKWKIKRTLYNNIKKKDLMAIISEEVRVSAASGIRS